MRKFNSMSPITTCFDWDTNPLIRIGVDRNLSYHKRLSEKIAVLKERTPYDKFILPWQGRWSTDVFELTENDILLAIKTYDK